MRLSINADKLAQTENKANPAVCCSPVQQPTGHNSVQTDDTAMRLTYVGLPHGSGPHHMFSSIAPTAQAFQQLAPTVCRQLFTRICKLHLDLTSTHSSQRHVYTAATCIHVDTDFKPNQEPLYQSCGAVSIRHFSAPRVRITPRHIRHFEYHGSVKGDFCSS